MENILFPLLNDFGNNGIQNCHIRINNELDKLYIILPLEELSKNILIKEIIKLKELSIEYDIQIDNENRPKIKR